MLRTIIFIGLILSVAYVAYLQSEKAKQLDMDKAENKVEQTQKQVERIMDNYEENLEQQMQKQLKLE